MIYCSFMGPLISIAEAAKITLGSISTAAIEQVPLSEANGRVLRKAIRADHPVPPFDRSMMDGVVIDSQEFCGIGTELKLAGTQAAGSPALEKLLPNTCFEIMTGATIPTGCDCVVPIEEISITNDSVIFSPDAIAEAGSFIHPEGSDLQQGATVLESGTLLGPAELGIAASCGATTLSASALPIVQIITTGDEVIDPSETPEPYQIRRSHPTVLTAMIEGNSLGRVQHTHIPDDEHLTKQTIASALACADILVLTGGVSKGKYDWVAPTLRELIGEATFHGVAQRPGKPFAFWKSTPLNASQVFALPGNPVSVMATATRYLLPALRKHAGLSTQPTQLPLAVDFNWKFPIPGFVPAKIIGSKAQPHLPSNSGDYLALAGADGFVELPQPKKNYRSNSTVSFFTY